MNKLKESWISIILVIIGSGLYILGNLVLPETIGVQIQLDGNLGNFIPTWQGLLWPLAFSVGFAIYGMFNQEKKFQSISISCFGLILYLLTFMLNLK